MVASAFFVLIIRSFNFVNIRELKRQARSGNILATKVYSAKVYGLQLQMLLWSIEGFLISVMIILISNVFGPVWTLFITIPFFAVIFAIIPKIKRPSVNLKFAAFLSPVLEVILRFSFPINRKIEHKLRRITISDCETNIFSKEELVDTIKQNAHYLLKDVDSLQLDAIENILCFDKQKVGDYMTTIDKAYAISGDEILSPVVFGEIYSSGFKRIPVFRGSKQNIIGTLYIRDISKNEQKRVNEIMHDDVFYINEFHSLIDAYSFFLLSKNHLLIVVNEFEDIVGVLNFEDVVEQLLKLRKDHKILNAEDLKAMSKNPTKDSGTNY